MSVMLENVMKPCTCADVKICSDQEKNAMIVSAELPGVKKEDIRLNFKAGSFCLSGERDDLRFDCCYEMPCDVDYKKSDAKFENGLLTIRVPIAEEFRGETIEIH